MSTIVKLFSKRYPFGKVFYIFGLKISLKHMPVYGWRFSIMSKSHDLAISKIVELESKLRSANHQLKLKDQLIEAICRND